MSASDATAGDGRVVVITGASSGIGAATARALAERGDRVAVVGRNPERTAAVASAVGGEAFTADFDRFEAVRTLAAQLLERYERLDVLVNNAGGMVTEYALTADGHERTVQSNLLSPHLLTELLLPRLIETAARPDVATGSVRVLATASMANRWGRLRLDDLDFADRAWRGGWPGYGTAKLGVVLWLKALAERLLGTGVSTFSVHPGVVATGFGTGSGLVALGNRLLGDRWGRSPEGGAAPLIALAVPGSVHAASGTYFERFRPDGRVAAQGRDLQLARDLDALLARLTAAPVS